MVHRASDASLYDTGNGYGGNDRYCSLSGPVPILRSWLRACPRASTVSLHLHRFSFVLAVLSPAKLTFNCGIDVLRNGGQYLCLLGY